MTALSLPPDLARAGCTVHTASDGRLVITLPDQRTCSAPVASWAGLVELARATVAAGHVSEERRAA